MAMMTGAQYIESLRKLNTRVYMFGEKIDNWVDHPIIRPSINCVAVTYDLAQDPQYEDLMTATSNLTGKKINRFGHIHQSTEDLKKKVKMQRLCGQKTASCFQRCVGMDAFNAEYSTTFEIDKKYGTDYHERFKKFLEFVQENDLVVDGAMLSDKAFYFTYLGIRQCRQRLITLYKCVYVLYIQDSSSVCKRHHFVYLCDYCLC